MFYKGQVVSSAAGHDKDSLYLVVQVEGDGWCRVADGKRRKVSRPKAKKMGHFTELTDSRHMYDHPVVHSLQQGEPVSDRALRRALAAFKEGTTLGER